MVRKIRQYTGQKITDLMIMTVLSKQPNSTTIGEAGRAVVQRVT